MRATAAIAIASILVTPACCAITCPSPCGPDTLTYAQSEMVVLPDGVRLARFDFTQAVTVYNGDNCPASATATGPVSLSITGLTTASFAYTITIGNDLGPPPRYAGTVTNLLAGATLDVGVIGNSLTPVQPNGPRIVAADVTFP